MSRKKKDTDEVFVVAQEIAAVVAVDVPKAKEETPLKKDVKLASTVEDVPVARNAPIRNIKVKATTSMKGRYNRYNYEIKAGEIYTFPEPLAKWLIDLGRAI